MKRPVRELLCQECSRDYPVWYVSNELWNMVTKEGEQFLCLTCFAMIAEARGVEVTAWRLEAR